MVGRRHLVTRFRGRPQLSERGVSGHANSRFSALTLLKQTKRCVIDGMQAETSMGISNEVDIIALYRTRKE